MAAFNGPGSPNNDNFLQAEVTVSSSGPTSPNNDNIQVAAHPTHTGAAAAPAPKPSPAPVQSVSVKLQIAHAEPFSVYLSSPDTDGVTLILVEVHIYNRSKDVFHTVVSHGDPVTLNSGDHYHVFPLTPQQLDKLMPHLAVGNVVEVKIRYSTPKAGELTIGIISKEHHHTLGQVVEHLLHPKSK